MNRIAAWISLCLILFFPDLSVHGAGLKWETGEGYRAAQLLSPLSGKPGFTQMRAVATGISFTNILPAARAASNANLMNGSGVALGDYDGDGLCDIYFCSLNGANVLYRNLGNWKFSDVTGQFGLACPKQASTGAVFADINGDGSLDLLVTSMGGPNACFLNDGHGGFTNVTAGAGLVSRLGSTSMALADVDGNGSLDLYVANYGATSIIRSGGMLNVRTVGGRQIVGGRYAQRIKIIDGVMYELGEPSVFYLNDGSGKFKPLSWTDGAFLDETGKPLLAATWDQSLSVLFRDMNLDGFPDIYVCNDAFTPDRCWLNDGAGRFRAMPYLAVRQTSYFSMGADFADIDRDGFDDFLVVDMQSRHHPFLLTQKGKLHAQPRVPGNLNTQYQIRRNTLFLGRGDETFAEVANYSGLASSEWSWSCIFIDVDLDGWEDVLVSNGFPYNVDDIDTQERIKEKGDLPLEESRRTLLLFPPLPTPNLAFLNQRDRTFREVGKEWGFDSKEVSNGMALADLDNDGDLDVAVNCLNGPGLIYRNESAAPRLAVRLRGNAPNIQGIGARIKVLGGPVTQSQEVICGGRYMSGDDPTRVFAAGQATSLTIEVTWQGGAHSIVREAKPNHFYEIIEPASPRGAAASAAQPLKEPAWFRDVSETLNHVHHEEAFDDFARQPLLPKQFSQLGPGVAWFDLNGDGREELIIGSGKGGRTAIYHNDPEKGFVLYAQTNSTAPAARDQTAVVGWASARGKTGLLVGLSNYEDGSTNGEALSRVEFQSGRIVPAPGISGLGASVGAISLGDIDGDGDLDLFLGSRVMPGRYPAPPSSMIFRNTDGQFLIDQKNTESLRNIGMVAASCFTDLDNDGFADLVCAMDWGPVRVLRNDHGQFRDATTSLGLAGTVGWWNGITTGDIDGDGRLDIVAANWGLNSPYQASSNHPARLYFGDLTGTGRLDLIEAYDDPAQGTVPWRGLDAMVEFLPFLRQKFSTHMAYAQSTIPKILGERMSGIEELRCQTLASTIFFNRGDHFQARPLPAEAQFTPGFAVCVGDMDGDGDEDLFLSQNFFATRPSLPCLDAGRGLWLRGDGTGGLLAMPGQESGVKVYGEQRGAALADYDADGRIDLVVTQNAGETKLYHNQRALPGLRVKLSGPENNPMGVGAAVRLRFGKRHGPIREVHAGSGYWSQDSPVLVMGAPEPPDQVWVRWPGGRTNSAAVPAGAKEIEVQITGELRVVR